MEPQGFDEHAYMSYVNSRGSSVAEWKTNCAFNHLALLSLSPAHGIVWDDVVRGCPDVQRKPQIALYWRVYF